MKTDIFNQKNEKIGEVDLSDRIFAVKWNPDLVHQILTAQLANRREPWAHTKTRGEVSGGGKKPWKQKGTGRARHGSIRSPLWVGGGVAFGPRKERNYAKKINKKMNRLAIFSSLSKKLKDNELKIIDKFDAASNKTKEWNKILKNLINSKLSVLIIAAAKNNIHRAISNIPKTDAIGSHSLNVYDLLKRKNILMEKGAVEEIEKYYK